MRAGLPALLAGVCLLLGGAARAEEDMTLAVMPITMGAGSEQYDGLGKALAGMLVSDLAGVQALRLVERERLDELMDELALADGAFIDPATAQQLGQGLGAHLVLLGSYSVVGETFLLDARIVQVGSGEILQAATAQGSVADFVGVEKELLDGLLDGLEVSLSGSERRALYLQAPTERFDAFAAYGEGLQRRDEGALEQASAAFERAVTLDPEFEAAREALGAIRGMVEAIRADELQQQQTWRDEAHRSILETWPDERERAADFEDDMHSAVGFALRLMVLENEELHCQRYAEMWHHLERNGWQVSEQPRGPDDIGVFSFAVGKIAEQHGFGRLDRAVPAPEIARESPSARSHLLWRTTADFVMDAGGHHPGDDWGSGLLGAMAGCHEPGEQLAEIDRIAARVAQAGLADQQQDRSPTSRFTLAESLQLAWCHAHARSRGASADMHARLEALLAGRTDDDPVRDTLLREVERVADEAEQWATHRARQMNREPAELVAAMQALAGRQADGVDLGPPACAEFAASQQRYATDWMLRYGERADDPRWGDLELDWAGVYWATLRDLGCLEGGSPRFDSWQTGLAFVQTAPDRRRPEAGDDERCDRAFADLDRLVQSFGSLLPNDAYYAALFNAYYREVVYNRCVDEPW